MLRCNIYDADAIYINEKLHELFKMLKSLKREIPRRKAGYWISFDECLLHKVIYAMSNNIEKKT